MNNKVTFNQEQITRVKLYWSRTHVKYTQNKFFSSIYEKLVSKGELTENQWSHLDFLFKNGKSKYEAGILSTKY
jgi:hypothetical protein